MKTVIVDRSDIVITAKKSGIVVETQQIPYRLIDLLVLCGEMEIGTKTLLALAKEGVSLLTVSKNNRTFSLTLPLAPKNGELKMLQYRSVTKNRLNFAKYFLEEKIKTHAKHLEKLGFEIDLRDWMQKIREAETVSQMLGIEGSFSNIYFSRYFSVLPKALHKSRRSKRPPLDPVNAILSYLYTYFYHLITVRLHMNGFDPAISYLHEPFRSHNGLSSDILEVFRAKINEKTAEWFLEKYLKAEDFSKRDGVYLRFESRKRLWREIKTFGEDLLPSINDEIALLRSAIT
ncbi:CRISPR-associated protein Cas1 [Hydrogenimonas sp.]|nr:CRISPR-associated protein Cas1 [Hydrogenimonas sp.]